GQTRLETQRVPGTETARGHTGFDQRLHERTTGLRLQAHFGALLTGVAGAGHLDGASFVLGGGDAKASWRHTENVFQDLRRVWSLDRDKDGAVPDVGHHGFGLPGERRHHPLVVGGVGKDAEAVGLGPPSDEVVDDAALVVEHGRVLAAARLDALDVVGEETPDRVTGTWPGEVESPEMTDVEEAGGGPHRLVLGDDRVVAQRHLPAAEVREPRPQPDVEVVEWRSCHPVSRSPRSSSRTTSGGPGNRVGAVTSSR